MVDSPLLRYKTIMVEGQTLLRDTKTLKWIGIMNLRLQWIMLQVLDSINWMKVFVGPKWVIHDKMRVNNKPNSLKMTVLILFGQVLTENPKELLKLPELSQIMMESNGPLKLINKILKEKWNGTIDHNNSTMFKALAAKISTHHMEMTVAWIWIEVKGMSSR